MTTATADDTLDAAVLLLPAITVNGVARRAALHEFAERPRFETTAVSYLSRGVVLVIGDRERTMSAAAALKQAGLEAAVLINGPEPEGYIMVSMTEDELVAAQGAISECSGHLGHFVVRLEGKQGLVNLAREMRFKRDDFDLILDLSPAPVIDIEVPPPGYYAPASEAALERALAELPEMVGEYEKPKYFEYDPDICAHGERGLTGCSRCIDACPTDAIHSLGERIEVDPYLCQGGGSCATACPTGAIRYVYPPASHLLDGLRGLLRGYRERDGACPAVLFYSEWGRNQLAQWTDQLPESLLPIEVEDVGSVGLEVWLSALAYGAHQVWLLITDGMPAAISDELAQQLRLAREMLAGMGFEPGRIAIVSAADGAPTDVYENALGAAAGFAGFDDKRTNIRLAMDHLYQYAPKHKKSVSLTAPAPFGEIKVNRDACTLCMGCVAVCPARALSDGEDMPRLTFIEANCVQCGLCANACPEDAIKLVPRFAYQPEVRSKPRTLHEEEPFHCINCGKPFATKSVMARMRQKLAGHWMYRDPSQVRRLEMCEDCRIEDLYLKNGGIEVYDKPANTDSSGGSE